MMVPVDKRAIGEDNRGFFPGERRGWLVKIRVLPAARLFGLVLRQTGFPWESRCGRA